MSFPKRSEGILHQFEIVKVSDALFWGLARNEIARRYTLLRLLCRIHTGVAADHIAIFAAGILHKRHRASALIV